MIKDEGAIVLTATQPFASNLIMSNIKMFKYEWIWHKSKCGSSFTAKYRPLSKHENILVFGKGKTKYNPQMNEGEPYKRKYTLSKTNNHKYGIRGAEADNKGTRHPSTVQYFQQKWRRQDQLHPTQKPVPLFEYLIKTYSNENDLILDNCAGSGTTGVAAFNTNRNCIMIEKELEYCDIIKNRMNELTIQNRL
jgi:site-specific DNA-methyltransferase (adenine-specific)